MLNAFEQVRAIEAAVQEGDLERANEAAVQLLPALVNGHMDELVELRQRIDSLTLGVKSLQTQSVADMRQLKQQRGGAATYASMQNHGG